MYASQHEEHLAHSAPCASRWDGFDRGDVDQSVDAGSRVIGRMTSGGGYKVEIIEIWSGYDTDYEVHINKSCVHFTENRAQAVTVARWWMAGCPD